MVFVGGRSEVFIELILDLKMINKIVAIVDLFSLSTKREEYVSCLENWF